MKIKKIIASLVAAAMFITAAVPAFAEEDSRPTEKETTKPETPATYSATFTVIDQDSKKPVKSPTIKVSQDNKGITDLDKLAAGTYQYDITAEGYEEAKGEFTVKDADVTVKVTMSKVVKLEEDETYTVSFDLHGHGNSISPVIVKSGEKIPKVQNPTAYGWTFKGWYWNNELWNFDKDVVEDDITLHARWSEKKRTYVVHFDLQGKGNSVVRDQVIDEDDRVSEPYEPEANGYIFKGWYKDAKCTEAWNFNKDEVTEDMTLYAYWRNVKDDKDEQTPSDKPEKPDKTVTDKYKDLAGHWALPYITEALKLDLFEGTSENEFSPDQPITRAQFVIALGRLERIDPDKFFKRAFVDVAPGSYYAPYIDWASRFKLIYGYEGDLFRPERTLTREEMAAVIYRYCEFSDIYLSKYYIDPAFKDEKQISFYAYKAVTALKGAGLIKGVGNNTFEPKGILTRAEVATILVKVHELQEKQKIHVVG